ncbi:nicotinate phosphoribosyltransferase [Sulfurirhabdus autotrophica]|uniref:Nicotinamide phosphoribosyltransferase n=1 Tax=Sulfurirhabdus autotrophica TaxID=1706046 RepID=A0A4V2W0X5_9PROT|nr:nicotinate phosphoribosyltransferase [Sulfurirhabdus autotrophica]TCV81225.1 nicotinamide phosphoribosyltransferase [Sulfurirhabdus autotrophica]
MNAYNLILDTDSYKASHWLQYPPGTEGLFSYIESRGGDKDKTLFFGLQMYLKEYLSKPITQAMIDEAEAFFTAHGEPFNREGWEYILKRHNGYLPIRIKAVPEGSIVPVRNVLVTVESTDPVVFWLPTYIETALLRAVWYPTTVATNSWFVKQVIRKYLEETADDISSLPFKLHDFGARGVSSRESAAIGGAAHLVNFMGSDTISGTLAAKAYYNEPMAAYSVPAAEHSSMTAWGRLGEEDAYRNMLVQFGKPGAIVSVVSDTYDIYHAVDHIWGTALKEEVIQSGAMLVIRPDSGDPSAVVLRIAQLVEARFGADINRKDYKVLKHVRILQGDGVNEKSIEAVLANLKENGYSAENAVFGMGGALLQQLNRDTQKFAMKSSAAKINGVWQEIYKDPVTDTGKRSKRGKLTLVRHQTTGEYKTSVYPIPKNGPNSQEVLIPVFENGNILKEWTFGEVRQTALNA